MLERLNEQALKSEDFIRFITHSHRVYWRIKAGEKQVEFLNMVQLSGLEAKTDVEHLLTNLVFAQNNVVEEDFFRFKLFIKAMRENRESTVIFRIKDKPDHRAWFRMTGAPGTSDPSYFYGSIHDITEHVSFIDHLLQKDLERQTMIEHDDIPVLLIDMENKTIISRNTISLQVFGYSFQEFDGKVFPDIYPPDQASHVSKAYEACLLNGSWEGELTFIKKNNLTFNAGVKMKRLSLRDRNLLRVAIYTTSDNILTDLIVPPSSTLSPDDFSRDLLTSMTGKFKIEEILDTLLGNQFRKPLFESVLYADIYEDKDRIDVYARGGIFDSMKPGVSYPFKGSVSQAIQHNRLPFYIIEDTLLSTRPIDWALFIPYGIRSYFAAPFYRGEKLRSLLMLCSTDINRFSEKDRTLYELYYPAFLQGLRNWRKEKRSGRPKFTN